MIFCDFAHLKPVTFKNAATGQEAKGSTDHWYFYNNNDEIYLKCNKTELVADKEKVMAYTNMQEITYIEGSTKPNVPKEGSMVTKPGVIHLCDPYLQNHTSFQRPSGIAPIVSKMTVDTALVGSKETQADLLAGLDHYLFQEFIMIVNPVQSLTNAHERKGQGWRTDRWLDRGICL